MVAQLLLIFLLFPIFPISVFANEKLVIVSTSPKDNIPEEVRHAAKAIGVVSAKTGFFIDAEVFVSPITAKWEQGSAIGPIPIFHFREATEYEMKVAQHLQEGEIIVVFAGQATLTKSHRVNGDSWGAFKVDSNKEELFTEKPTKFLKFSEFQKGDRVFLLSSYYYQYEDPDDKTVRKRNMIMKVANSPIEDIDTGIDLEKSLVLKMLRHELNNGVAVNQRGEVIGFIDFKDRTGKLTKVTSDLTVFFSEVTLEIAAQRKINGSSWSLRTEAVEFNRSNRSEKCLNRFRKSTEQ